MIKTIFLGLLKLKNKNFSWRIPSRAPLVVYHNGSYQRELGHFINQYKHICFNRTDVEVLLPILLLSILVKPFRRKCSLLDGYVDAFLWVAKCSVVLTVKDNDTTFYSISARNKNIKTIIIQNGVRNFHFDVFSSLSAGVSFEQSFHVDYAFVFGSGIASLYQERLGCSAIPIGCYKANARLPRASDNCSSGKFVLFISNYAPRGDSCVFPSRFNCALGIAFKSVCKWAFSKGISISVLSRCKASSRKDIIQEEYSFYSQSSIDIPFEMIYSSSHEESYFLIESSPFNVGVDSTLCYESMQLGRRTVFISIRGALLNLEDWRYGWPAVLPEQGSFWTNSIDYADHCKVLDFGFFSSDEDWEATLEKYFWGSVMSTSPQNIAVKKVLEELLPSHDV